MRIGRSGPDFLCLFGTEGEVTLVSVVTCPRSAWRRPVPGITTAPALAVEFYLADAGTSPLELLGGDDDLADVLIGLSEMGAELVDAVAQAAEIVHQVSDLGVNFVGGLAHLAVAMDLLDYLDRQHQQRWDD